MVGFVIDVLLAKRQNMPIKIPDWFILIASLWVISAVFLMLFADDGLISPVSKVIFPLAYGIFFTSVAYTILMPKTLENSAIAKAIFDIICLYLFVAWLMLPKKKYVQKKILLGLLFLIFIIGFVGCAVTVS